MSEHYLKRFPKVKALIFDVDGVLTDGKIMLMPGVKDPVRSIHTRDAFALRTAVDAGLYVAVLSRGHSEELKTRLLNFGLSDAFFGKMDKEDTLEEILHIYTEFTAEEILYMGDDIPDLPVLNRVGIPTCPEDAAHEVRSVCKYISPHKGGEGAVRDVIEKVLRTQNKWPK